MVTKLFHPSLTLQKELLTLYNIYSQDLNMRLRSEPTKKALFQAPHFKCTFLKLLQWRHDNQQNDTQHNNDIQHSDTQQKELLCDTQHK